MRARIMDTTTQLKQELKTDLEQLRKLRDEIRLQLHLASMDAKSTWAEIEPQLSQLERNASEAVTAATRAALTEAIKRLIRFRAALPLPH